VKDTFTITDLSEEFGITPRTIRFYEDEGLITPARSGLNRIYSRRDRGRLILILRGKRVGFSIKEIKEMLDLYDLGDGQVEQARHLITKSRERIDALVRQREDIDQAIRELEEGCRGAEKLLRKRGVALSKEKAEAHGV
jgi:DNA-binding transcriptional MerR regulator